MPLITLLSELRALQQPWFTQDVPLDIQEKVRYAVQLIQIGGKSRALTYLSGGNGTVRMDPLEPDELASLEKVIEKEYFKKESDADTDAKSVQQLQNELRSRGVTLLLEQYSGRNQKQHERVPLAEISDHALQIVKLLPEHHFGHAHFTQLRLGGWSSSAAKFSEYVDPLVHLFDFALNGPRRNFYGLLLHEMGHGHYELLKETNPELAAKFANTRPPATFGVDYVQGDNARRYYVYGSLDEFAAEFYLIYVTQGERLQEFIKVQPQAEAKRWRMAYDIFTESFQGREYR